MRPESGSTPKAWGPFLSQMGCTSSLPSDAPTAASPGEPPAPFDSADPSGIGLRVGESTNNGGRPSRRLSLSASGMEAPELQNKLEKLDEERTKLQEELRRLQSATALEQDSELTDGSNGEKPRVRFSKIDGVNMPSLPAPSSQDQRPQMGRRASSSSIGTLGRLSSYRGGGHVAPGGEERSDRMLVNQPGRTDMKVLAEMVNRGRRRTRYTQRASGGEESTRRAVTPAASSDAKVNFLPRGGVHVQTKYGAVQFGLPPETIKDSMSGGLEVPIRRSMCLDRSLMMQN